MYKVLKNLHPVEIRTHETDYFLHFSIRGSVIPFPQLEVSAYHNNNVLWGQNFKKIVVSAQFKNFDAFLSESAQRQ
jgi:hypothetical protein